MTAVLFESKVEAFFSNENKKPVLYILIDNHEISAVSLV